MFYWELTYTQERALDSMWVCVTAISCDIVATELYKDAVVQSPELPPHLHSSVRLGNLPSSTNHETGASLSTPSEWAIGFVLYIALCVVSGLPVCEIFPFIVPLGTHLDQWIPQGIMTACHSYLIGLFLRNSFAVSSILRKAACSCYHLGFGHNKSDRLQPCQALDCSGFAFSYSSCSCAFCRWQDLFHHQCC